jgi:hypothetical protein
VENFANPLSAVLTAAVAEPAVDSIAPQSLPVMARSANFPAPPPAGARGDEEKGAAKQSAQTLVDKFHADERGSRASGILPLRVNLPSFGPSIYLVSQLTSENQSPSAEFTYQQDKKAGGK